MREPATNEMCTVALPSGAPCGDSVVAPIEPGAAPTCSRHRAAAGWLIRRYVAIVDAEDQAAATTELDLIEAAARAANAV